MNRFRMVLGMATAGLAATVTLAGCGTGQIAQTTDKVAAVNGADATVGTLTLRDVRIQANQTGDFIQPGKTVDLLFVVSNQSQQNDDELTGVTSPVGSVALTGSRKLPAGGQLIFTAPAGAEAPEAPPATDLHAVSNAHTGSAAVALSQPITNGLNYDFTFTFKGAGPVKVSVPLSVAADTTRRG